MSTATAPNPYSLSGYKSFLGREGYGFNATLNLGGRKIAEVIDSGNGGCLRYHWLAKNHDQRLADEAGFMAYARSLPPENDAQFGEIKMDDEILLARMVDALEFQKKAKRLVASKVLLQRPDGAVVTLKKVKPTPEVLARAQAQFPTYRVLNAQPIAAVVAALASSVGG